jgi:hypothetical protein
VERSSGQYELGFEGLILVATEGGIFMYSRTCPGHVLRFSALDDGAERQLEAVQRAANDPMIMGIRGRAVVVPARRKDEHHLGVRVVALPLLSPMTATEQADFMRHFHIG